MTFPPSALLLIDSAVQDYQVFVHSVNSTTIPFVYSAETMQADLTEFLLTSFNQTKIARIGVVFEGSSQSPLFLGGQPLFSENGENANAQFLIDIIREYSVANIDFLGCGTLNYANWNAFYSTLTRETGIIVGASSNNTGNIQYGGDWVMESTAQDIEAVYFNQNIEYYQNLLDQSNSVNTYYIDTNNDLWGFGSNQYGQLSYDNPSITSSQMTPGLSGEIPIAIATGSYFAMILTASKNVWGVGYNASGQLGTADTVNRLQLTRVLSAPYTSISGETPLAISCGTSHTMLLTTSGNVWGTGLNSNGQLGLNDVSSRTVFTRSVIGGSIGISGEIPTYIAAGNAFTLLLTASNNIWGTGGNASGQLGLNDISNRRVFTRSIVGGSTGISGEIPLGIVGGSGYSILYTASNNIWVAGVNGSGQLGMNDVTLRKVFTRSTTWLGRETIKSIMCGSSTTTVLTASGNIYCAGANSYGQFGNGNTNISYSFIKTAGPGDISGEMPFEIASGQRFTTILTTSGNVWGAGSNIPYNQLQVISPGNVTSFTKNSYFYPSIKIKQMYGNLPIQEQQNPSLTWPNAPSTVTYGIQPFLLIDPSSNSSGAFTYSTDSDLITISGSLVSVYGSGNATINAHEDACGNYNSGDISATLTILPSSQSTPTPIYNASDLQYFLNNTTAQYVSITSPVNGITNMSANRTVYIFTQNGIEHIGK